MTTLKIMCWGNDMDRVLKVGDTIFLENDMPFQVLYCLEYNGEAYAYIYKLPNNIANVLDPEKLERTFVKEVIVDGNLEVEEVLDENLYRELRELILEHK